ncbi:MAG: ATP-binding protein [Planctomycetes bacterium]|nr:ATP-binding protein [Planctomycetota bacterium]
MTEILKDDFPELFEAWNRQAEVLSDTNARLLSQVASLKAELAQKSRQLARKKRLALLGEMAAGVAHEIRNPLGGIQLYADLLGRSMPEGTPERDLLARLQGGIRHLDRIVGDLLLYTKDLEPALADCRLDQVVEEALSYARPALESAGATVERRFEQPPVRVPADPSLLCRVVLNLITNAAAAVEKDSGRIEVRVERTPAGDGRIAVADNGSGIAPEDLERIFHPFFSKRPGGTGLGLSICHRIVDAHRGAIDVESTPGKGTTVRFELPGRAGDA